MIFVAAAMIGLQKPPAEGVLRDALGRYTKLKSFSATVTHHADFLSDVKDSSDKLVWAAPKRFEITSNKDSIPKLACDGKKLTTFIPNIAPVSEPFESETIKAQPWETRGGILLSLLMKGAVANQILHPEKPLKTSFDYGKTMNWHGRPVTEIIETLSIGAISQHVSFFLSANAHQLFGTQVDSGPENSWTEYTDLIENPTVSKDLGTVAH